MASTVGTTTFVEDGTRNYFTLNNRDQYLRTFYVPPIGWNNINIAVSYAIEATGALSAGNGLWLGLTTSATPGVGFKQASYPNTYTGIARMLGVGSGAIGY